jgi:signal transduction histidine kinase/CheY-like chemotaxis protein
MARQIGNQFYKTVVTIWLTLSVGSVILSAISWFQLSAQMAAGRQMANVRNELSDIFKSLINAETAQRGYIITDDKKYLEPFYETQTNLSAKFDLVLSQVHDNPPLLNGVTQLRVNSQLIFNWLQDDIDLRKWSFERAENMISEGDGRKIMDNIRAQASQLDRICVDQQTAIHNKIQSHVMRASLTSLIAGIFGVGAGLLAFWLARVAMRHQQRERELVEAKLQAERSSQEKSAFLANMSHEIRTPMNAILGFSELLQNDLREPKHRQYLRFIRSSAGSLLQLINDILDMSKIESGALELRPEPTDPREICDFIRTLFSEPAAKKGLKLQFHVAQDLPHALLIDRIRLRQIMVNLVGNAIKFTDKGGIEVRVLWERQFASSHVALTIEVQDTGVGIPQDKLDAIFKPFVQAGAHRDKEKQGTGLGLSIVKRLTETMGGTVTVTSKTEQGSAFHLRFPSVPISARLPASEKTALIGEVDFNDLRSTNLLVVDDNETNCQLIAGMFADTHHRLFFAFNGEDAIAKARELKPDILLLDVRMPGMDGHETLGEIRKIPGLELIPSIAVTASTLLDGENLLKERFNGYVRKPFSKRELFDELAEFLPRHVKTEVMVKRGGGKSVTPEASVPVAKELLLELRDLIIEPWPSIRDSAAINESKTFALKLKNLGKEWNCEPLTNYAKKLLHDAENYAVTDLEEHLGEFSALVEQLDRQTQI